MNSVIEAICLYLKSYIPSDNFLDYVYMNVDEVENILNEDVFLALISVNLSDKVSVEHVIVMLEDFIRNNYLNEYNVINDVYLEEIIDSDRKDFLAISIRENNKRKELVVIDISELTDDKELIQLIKKELEFPQFCGNSWEALDDLIYDIILPLNIEIIGCQTVENEIIRKMRKLFSRINDVCQIIYK